MDFQAEEKEIGEGNADSNDGASVPDFIENLGGVVLALAVDGGVEQAIETQ
jgi:hypothetical protein